MNLSDSPPSIEGELIAKIRDFQDGCVLWGEWAGSGLPPAVFTGYLASYAHGDWDCNPTALENMLMQTVRWSRNRINASVRPKAISVGDEEIFKVRPPFFFLTGHRDFHFPGKEIENLRQYLMIGGASWIDNSLPGRHSRFEEAVRREMKRVLPHRDFEPVRQNHEIFNAHFRRSDVPAGMNHYPEPIEPITLHDEVALVYTLNAYSDLWETALNEDDKIDTEHYLDEDTGHIYQKWGPHWGSSLPGFLYRNVNEDSIKEANRLGLNILVHLLIRYEDKFRRIGKL